MFFLLRTQNGARCLISNRGSRSRETRCLDAEPHSLSRSTRFESSIGYRTTQQQPRLAGFPFADQPKCRHGSDQLRRSLRHRHIIGTVDAANWQQTRRGDGEVESQRASDMEAALTWSRPRHQRQKRDASGQSLIPGPLPSRPFPQARFGGQAVRNIHICQNHGLICVVFASSHV